MTQQNITTQYYLKHLYNTAVRVTVISQRVSLPQKCGSKIKFSKEFQDVINLHDTVCSDMSTNM